MPSPARKLNGEPGPGERAEVDALNFGYRTIVHRSRPLLGHRFAGTGPDLPYLAAGDQLPQDAE